MAALNRIGTQLVALILAVALPLAGVMGFVWHKAVEESNAAATEVLRLTTTRVVSDLRRMQQQSEWMMAQLAMDPEVRSLSPTACRDEARLLRRLHPEFLNLAVFNRSGELVCSSAPLTPGARLTGPRSEAFARSLQEGTFEVSEIFFGNFSRRHVVLLTHPITSSSGTIVGVLTAGVSGKYFDSMLNELNLPEGSAIAVLDRNHAFVARIPEGDKWRGSLAKDLPLDQIPAADARTAGLVQGIDGVERLYIEDKVPHSGWKVYAGIPSERVLSKHRAWLLGVIAATLFMIVGSGTTAYAIAASLSRRFRSMLRGEQELMSRLLRAEEQERTRISRELHDQIGQELTALSLDLKTLGKQAAPEVLERAVSTAERLIDEVRDVSLALRPSQLDDLGLAAALRAHVDRHVRPHGAAVHVDFDVEPGRLAPEVEVACFRVAQEALTNVLRHARAANVWIRLRAEGAELVLVVRDDGVGFDVEAELEAAAGELRSLGLRNLFDRTRLAGGELEIRSTPSTGVEVRARFPL